MDVNRVAVQPNTVAQSPPTTGEGGEAVVPVPQQAPPPVPSPTSSTERGQQPRQRGDDTLELDRAVTELNRSLSSYRRHMSIRMHTETNRRMVRVYDSETDEVIREIPPEGILDAHANLLELAGLLIDQRG
jgi:flagellar protein FlaG